MEKERLDGQEKAVEMMGGILLKKEFLAELRLNEDSERECKLAEGGLPESIWETIGSWSGGVCARSS